MIAEIKRRHPWPDREPDAPEDWHGWLRSDTHAMLYRHLNATTRLVVECGTWLGLSTRAILFGAPNATVICCDHWKGSPEQQADPDCARRLPRLYETFLRNLWPWRERVIPIRSDSLEALAEIEQAVVESRESRGESREGRVESKLWWRVERGESRVESGEGRGESPESRGESREQAMVGRRSACPTLRPDLVYLDTEHTYDRVSRELAFCTDHWPSATIVGDDYDWPEVARAATEHAQCGARRNSPLGIEIKE